MEHKFHQVSAEEFREVSTSFKTKVSRMFQRVSASFGQLTWLLRHCCAATEPPDIVRHRCTLFFSFSPNYRHCRICARDPCRASLSLSLPQLRTMLPSDPIVPSRATAGFVHPKPRHHYQSTVLKLEVNHRIVARAKSRAGVEGGRGRGAVLEV